MLRTRVVSGPISSLVMSLVFATLMTLVQAGDGLVKDWSPRPGSVTPTTLRAPYSPWAITRPRTDGIPAEHKPQHTVVPRGTLVNLRTEAHRTAYRFEMERRSPRPEQLGGMFVVMFTVTMALTSYLRRFGQNRIRLVRTQVGLLVAMGLLTILAKALLLFTALPPLWIPMATVPLFMATVYDRRAAIVVSLAMAFIVGSLIGFDLVLLIVMLARSMAATVFYLDKKQPRQMLLSGILAGFSAAGLYVAMVVIFEGEFDVLADVSSALNSGLASCIGGGLAAGLLAVMLRVQAERILGNVSRERLLELQDLTHPMLEQLAHRAPGTFAHCRAVANLAEQAASAIGIDALLTRVGAYYHDVGKMARSKYFVENLPPEEVSPHDTLEPEVSSEGIIAHVVEGTRMLRARGIPEPVVEFCYSHHGTSVIEYFWQKCQLQGNPRHLSVSRFTYPGKRPQTKETGIVMLVDAIEAASRTVDAPSRETFETMVERLVYMKLSAGQLDDCALDLSELRVIIAKVIEALVNQHHHRIKYHWQVEQAEEFGVPAQAVRYSSCPELEFGQPEAPPSARPLAGGGQPPGRPRADEHGEQHAAVGGLQSDVYDRTTGSVRLGPIRTVVTRRDKRSDPG
ncbi:HDIG domain-containing metalloprotein [Myxococcota bacterium]